MPLLITQGVDDLRLCRSSVDKLRDLQRRWKARLTPTNVSSILSIVRNRVRELREQAGLSQAALGAALGVSRQTINAIERRRYLPSLPLAFQLARFFDAPIEEVFDAEQ